MRTSVALSILVIGCGSATPPEANAVPPAPASFAPTPPPSATPATSESCGGATCHAPEECISVVGMSPGSARKECWILCAADPNKCPAGMTCTMIHDGPGQVCVKK